MPEVSLSERQEEKKDTKDTNRIRLKIIAICSFAAFAVNAWAGGAIAQNFINQSSTTKSKINARKNIAGAINTKAIAAPETFSQKEFASKLQAGNSDNYLPKIDSPIVSAPAKTDPIKLPVAPRDSLIPSVRKSAVLLSQGVTFPDIQGHWARSFIEALAARDIIRGFPDGSFRPDEPVTRAQFAAMVRKAFKKAKVRQAVRFVDVPTTFWGYTAVQEAYEMGFLEGYPNRVFNPNQSIPRVQVLVSLATGLNLSTTTAVNLNNSYQDAAEIPTYATNQIAAATANRLVVNYPNLNTLSPNQTATRADVAAFIYQALVSSGELPALPATDVASQYIVGYQPPVAQTPPTDTNTTASLDQLLLPEPPVVEVVQVGVGKAPASSITSPIAFGIQWRDAFVALGYQARTRYTDKDDAAFGIGLGFGDARDYAGLEVTYTSFSTIRQGGPFETGGLSFKVHRLISNDIAIAAGVENVLNYGGSDAGVSPYGVISKYFQLKDDEDKPFSALVVSAGVGGGRFRSESDIRRDRGSVNAFGSVGLRVARPVSLIADWSGQDLGLGLSIVPFRNIPLSINPSVVDVTGNAGDGARFSITVGYGIRF